MPRLALLAMSLVACGREVDDEAIRAPRVESLAVAAPVVFDSQTSDVGRRTSGVPCPPSGSWAECSLFERLDRAGLAPRRDTSAVSEPPLTVVGTLLRVGTAELELYLYPDAAAREREQRLLDRAQYTPFDAPLTMQALPTLIANANLIVILHSRNEHLRERVADAITAGPPQPSRP